MVPKLLTMVLTFLSLCASENLGRDYRIETEPLDIEAGFLLNIFEYDTITDQVSMTVAAGAFSITFVMDSVETNEEFVGAPVQSELDGEYTGSANYEDQDVFARVVFSNSTLVLSVSSSTPGLNCSDLLFKYWISQIDEDSPVLNSTYIPTTKPTLNITNPTLVLSTPSSIRPTPTPTWIRGEPTPTPTWIRGEPTPTPTWFDREPTPTPTWIRGVPSLMPTSEMLFTQSPSLSTNGAAVFGIDQESSWIAIGGTARLSTIFLASLSVLVGGIVCIAAYRRWYRKRFDYNQLSRYDAEYYQRWGAGWSGGDGESYHSKRDVELSQYLGDEPEREFPVLTL